MNVAVYRIERVRFHRVSKSDKSVFPVVSRVENVWRGAD